MSKLERDTYQLVYIVSEAGNFITKYKNMINLYDSCSDKFLKSILGIGIAISFQKEYHQEKVYWDTVFKEIMKHNKYVKEQKISLPISTNMEIAKIEMKVKEIEIDSHFSIKKLMTSHKKAFLEYTNTFLQLQGCKINYDEVNNNISNFFKKVLGGK